MAHPTAALPMRLFAATALALVLASSPAAAEENAM